MSLFQAIEYIVAEFTFNYHSDRYQIFKDISLRKAKIHLAKAVEAGREFIELGGYVSLEQRNRLRYLESRVV